MARRAVGEGARPCEREAIFGGANTWLGATLESDGANLDE